MKPSQVGPAEIRVKFLQDFMKHYGSNEYLQYELRTLVEDLQEYYEADDKSAPEYDYVANLRDQLSK